MFNRREPAEGPEGAAAARGAARRSVQYSIHIGTFELNLATKEVFYNPEQTLPPVWLEPHRGPLSSSEATSHIHPDDLPAARTILEEAIAHRSSCVVGLRAVWPDGSVHWIRSHGHYVSDADGRFRSVSWERRWTSQNVKRQR